MPAPEKLETLADLTILIDAERTARMVSESLAVTPGPEGGTAVAVPVLVIEPLSTSAWVVV